MITNMDQITVIGLLSFFSILISVVVGAMTIRKNLREYTQDVVKWQVALEHRLTQVETTVQWIKEHLPKRRGDYD